MARKKATFALSSPYTSPAVMALSSRGPLPDQENMGESKGKIHKSSNVSGRATNACDVVRVNLRQRFDWHAPTSLKSEVVYGRVC